MAATGSLGGEGCGKKRKDREKTGKNEKEGSRRRKMDKRLNLSEACCSSLGWGRGASEKVERSCSVHERRLNVHEWTLNASYKGGAART